MREKLGNSGRRNSGRKAAESRRQRAIQRSRQRHAAAAEIGTIPKVKNRKRRQACRKNLLRFLTTYFPETTGLKPFSDDHRRIIDRIQSCILHRGRFVNAVYRGFAKTTISENAALWAVLNGHRRFVAIFGANATAASDLVDSIKRELEENDLLLADFPEVCKPVRCLEGKPQRCKSQTHKGKLTHIGWTAQKIVLPRIAGSKSSSAVICTRSILSARGMKQKAANGRQVRPDFVIIDDPQSDESAASDHQVTKRLGVIKRSILRTAGHNRSIAIVINATVIQDEDLIDQLLDHKRNPAWQGERIPMVHQWADQHETLWLGRYAHIRNDYNPEVPQDQLRAHHDATEFYRAHRSEMDAGCRISWVHCFDPDAEISAIQHAYNALIDDGPEVFASEYQQAPMRDDTGGPDVQTANEIAERTNGFPRSVVPLGCEQLVMFIDVHDKLLYYAVAAWTPEFTGYIIDYGTLPDQRRHHFTMRQVTRTLGRSFPKMGKEAAILAGLQQLTDDNLGREWQREDGSVMRIGRCLIDAGYASEQVELACRKSSAAALLLPSRGIGIGAVNKPFSEYTFNRGDLRGHHLYIPAANRAAIRHVRFDANYWKSFLHARLAVALGDKGSLSLYGKSGAEHRLFSEHLVSERPIRTEGRGRTVDEWRPLPGHDNHWLDAAVGCAVAASLQGAVLFGTETRTKSRKKKRRIRATPL